MFGCPRECSEDLEYAFRPSSLSDGPAAAGGSAAVSVDGFAGLALLLSRSRGSRLLLSKPILFFSTFHLDLIFARSTHSFFSFCAVYGVCWIYYYELYLQADLFAWDSIEMLVVSFQRSWWLVQSWESRLTLYLNLTLAFILLSIQIPTQSSSQFNSFSSSSLHRMSVQNLNSFGEFHWFLTPFILSLNITLQIPLQTKATHSATAKTSDRKRIIFISVFSKGMEGRPWLPCRACLSVS